MDKVLKDIEYWSQIFILPIYAISTFFPRDKKLWAFGSTFGHRFADNPKYFYLYINQLKAKEIRAVWISKNKNVVNLLKENNLEAYSVYSVRGLWYSLRAKVYIYDNYSKDICFWLSGGAVKINLWHGIPLKKINMDNKFDPVRNPNTKWKKVKYALRRISDEKPSHYVLTTSKFLVPIFSSAFATKKVISCGYPRNDILTSTEIENVLTQIENDILNEIIARMNQLKNAKIILYMPTFRESESDFFDMLDEQAFDDFIKQKNIILCIKPHPKSKVKMEYSKLESANIIMIDAEADPYVYLSYTDALITDYSSIYFDYLLLDKPIIFFCYDLDKYLNSSREMYFNYDEFTPGIKANSMEELENILSDVESSSDNTALKNKRVKMSKRVFDKGNVKASETLYHYIQNDIL
ncbi:MAG: CDP-glycerol glycerophosphotransferase family protein [Anaerocolumna sp.]